MRNFRIVGTTFGFIDLAYHNFLLSAFTQTAFNIIQEHPQVIPDRVGIFGLSLGSLVTMHIAAESSVVKASDRWLILVAEF